MLKDKLRILKQQFHDHAGSFVKTLSFEKIINFFKVEYNLWKKEEAVSGLPYFATFATNNICNLECPLCPTGRGQYQRPPSQMPFSLFKKAIDEIYPVLFEIGLYKLGEPLLNPEIFRMVKYARAKNISVSLSTNFSFAQDGLIDSIFKSNLDKLYVSIDGATQRTYEQYQKKGNLQLVFDNLEQIVRIKRKNKLKTPFISWQFIVSKYNENEIPLAKEKAKQIGVDEISFRAMVPSAGKVEAFTSEEIKEFATNWSATDAKYRIDSPSCSWLVYEQACYWLWRGIVINPDGGVSACCAADDINDDFGSVNENSIKEIWNNQKYRASRRLFNKDSKMRMLNNKRTVCFRCNMFKKQ